MKWWRKIAEIFGVSGEGTPSTPNPSQASLSFLKKTLKKIDENPNRQLIYAFWRQNLPKLDATLAQVLDQWGRETLKQATPEDAYNTANLIIGFSVFIRQFPLGDIAINQEIAIAGYEVVLTLFTFEAFPQDWAMTQNNLALAYRNRIRGDKADNLETAIAAYDKRML